MIYHTLKEGCVSNADPRAQKALMNGRVTGPTLYTHSFIIMYIAH